MPYLGNAPDRVYVETIKDRFSGDDSSTVFTLSVAAQANTLEVLVENVQQEPTVSYTVSGTTLTFDSAPPSGTNNIYVIHRDPSVATPTIGTAQIEDNSVTNLKLANDSASFAQVTLTATNGVVKHTGSGDLYLTTDADAYITSNDFSETYADFTNGGGVKLYYNNILRSETTDSGARVYGRILADSATINGNIAVGGRMLADSATITRDINVGGGISADSATINGNTTISGSLSADSATISGNIAISGKATAAIATLTDSATITADFEANQNFTVTLAGNRTMANPLNIEVGQTGSIFLVQDSTGSRTLSFGSYWDFPAGTAPTLTTTANAVDRLDYIVRTGTSIHSVFTADYS